MLAKIRSVLGRFRSKEQPVPAGQAIPEHAERLERIRAHDASVTVLDRPKYEMGDHPGGYRHFECAFAAKHVPAEGRILDVGSYRLFILGLLLAERLPRLT